MTTTTTTYLDFDVLYYMVPEEALLADPDLFKENAYIAMKKRILLQ